MNENLELVSGIVTVNVRHEFTPDELAKESQQLAKSIQDKASVDNNKKVATSGFNNQIKILDGEIKKHSDNVTNGFTYKDVTSELYRDYERLKRVYILKGTETIIKEEDFRESDHQKMFPFDGEDTELTEIDRARQQQIEENNQAGAFAEGGDQLDNVINHKLGAAGQDLSNKVKKGIAKEKPTPKDNLGEHYGKSHEPDDDEALPNSDDLFNKVDDTE